MSQLFRLLVAGGLFTSWLLLSQVMVAAARLPARAGTEADAWLPKATVTAAATAAPTLVPIPTGPGQTPAAPVIAYFTCDPCAIDPGGSATLGWDLSGATAAYLDGQGVTAPGSMVVRPDQTTTFRLVATSDGGQSEKTVTVEVRGLPTIHYFTCLPCEIRKGERSTLSWDLSGATAAYLDGQGVAAPGDTVVAPAQTTTYRLVATSERGSVERLVTVTVKEGGDPEAVTESLRRPGYDVRWTGRLALAGGGDTVSVVMGSADEDFHSQATADQYFDGFKTLYENYPGQILTVALHDGVRYTWFVTAEPDALEGFMRGELDGVFFWEGVTWNVWDDWKGRWLYVGNSPSEGKDFASKNFEF